MYSTLDQIYFIVKMYWLQKAIQVYIYICVCVWHLAALNVAKLVGTVVKKYKSFNHPSPDHIYTEQNMVLTMTNIALRLLWFYCRLHLPTITHFTSLKPQHPEYMISLTRTARMPAFCDTPHHPWLHLLVIHIRSQIKTRQSQSYKLKKTRCINMKWIQPEL